MDESGNRNELPAHIVDIEAGTTEIFLYDDDYRPVTPVPVNCESWLGQMYCSKVVADNRGSNKKPQVRENEMLEKVVCYSKLYCKSFKFLSMQNAILKNWTWMSKGNKVWAETEKKSHANGIISYVFNTSAASKAKGAKVGK